MLHIPLSDSRYLLHNVDCLGEANLSEIYHHRPLSSRSSRLSGRGTDEGIDGIAV